MTPVVPFILALVFCCYNGFMQGAYLLHVSTYQDWWFSDPRFVIGKKVFGKKSFTLSNHLNLRELANVSKSILSHGCEWVSMLKGLEFVGASVSKCVNLHMRDTQGVFL